MKQGDQAWDLCPEDSNKISFPFGMYKLNIFCCVKSWAIYNIVFLVLIKDCDIFMNLSERCSQSYLVKVNNLNLRKF